MITIEQRIELLHGGYTPEQIEGFDNESQPAQQKVQPEAQLTKQPEAQPEAQPTKQPEAQPTKQPEAQPEAQPEKQPEEQPEYSNSDVMKELASLKSMIQAQNLANSFIPQGIQKDAATVLAEVIRPERKV